MLLAPKTSCINFHVPKKGKQQKNRKQRIVKRNIAKGTTDPGVEFCLPKSQVLT